MAETSLQELQQKLVQQTSLLKQVAQQSRMAETTAKRSSLTLRELQNLDESVSCYESVGRAYFLKPKSELEGLLKETEAASGKQQAELAKNREAIKKDVEAVETEIRELIFSEPKLAQQLLGTG